MSKAIAIVGASRDSNKFSYKAVKAYQSLGYDVYPVNPNSQEVAGLKSYPRIADLPQPVEEVSVYLPPTKTIGLLDELKDYSLEILYLNPGSADDKVRNKAKKLNLPVAEACSITAKGLSPADF